MTHEHHKRGIPFVRQVLAVIVALGIIGIVNYVPAAAAQMSTTTIDFERYGDATTFADPAVGLRFPTPVHGVCPTTVNVAGCSSASGKQAIEVFDSTEFFRAPMVIEFDDPGSAVALLVRASYSDPNNNMPPAQFYEMTAISEDGAVVGQSTSALTSFSTWTRLSVESPDGSASIARIEVHAWSDPAEDAHDHNTLVIDDLVIQRPDSAVPPPPADTIAPKIAAAEIGPVKGENPTPGYASGIHLVVTDEVDLAGVDGSIIDSAGRLVSTATYCVGMNCPTRSLNHAARFELGPDYSVGPLPYDVPSGKLTWHITACDSAGNCSIKDVLFPYMKGAGDPGGKLTAWRMEINQGAQSFIPEVTPPGSMRRFPSDQFDRGMTPLSSSRNTLVRVFITAPVETNVRSYKLQATMLGLDGSRRSRSYAPLGTTIPADPNGFSIDAPPSEIQTNVLLRRNLELSINYLIPEADLEKVDELDITIDGLVGRTELPFALPVRMGVNLVKLYGRELGGAGAITDETAADELTKVQEYLGLSDLDVVSTRTYRPSTNWLYGIDSTCSGILADVFLEFGTSDAPRQHAFNEPNVLPTIGMWQKDVGVDAGGQVVGCSFKDGMFPFGFINTIVGNADAETIAHELGHSYGQSHTSGHGEDDPAGSYRKGKVTSNSYGVSLPYGSEAPIKESNVGLQVPCPNTKTVDGWADCEADKDHLHDIMSYGSPVWTDSGRYSAIWGQMLSTWISAKALGCTDAQPYCGSQSRSTFPSVAEVKRLIAEGDNQSATVTKYPFPRPPTATTKEAPREHASAPFELTDADLVSNVVTLSAEPSEANTIVKWAVIRRADGSSVASPMVHRPDPLPTGSIPSSLHDATAPLHVQLVAADGTVLYENPTAFGTIEDEAGQPPVEATFLEMPYLPAATEVRLVETATGTVIVSERRSSIPTITIDELRRGGDGKVNIRWTTVDSDDDRFFSSVQASGDGGASWVGISSTNDSSTTVPPDELPTGSDLVFRVSVSDGFTTAFDERHLAPASVENGAHRSAESRGLVVLLLVVLLLMALALISAATVKLRRNTEA